MIDEQERKVYSILLKHFSKNRIRRNVVVSDRGSRSAEYDLVVGNAASPLFAIEVKSLSNITEKIFVDRVLPFYKPSNAKYIVLTNGESMVYTSQDNQYKDFITSTDFNATIHQLKESCYSSVKVNLQDVTKAIGDAIDKLDSTIKAANASPLNKDERRRYNNKINKLRSWKNGLQVTPDYEPKDDVVYLSEEKETSLFSILLGTYRPSTFVKFSSARSVYTLIQKHTQNMCSLSCMNDPSEKIYADRFTGFSDAAFDANTTFIISGCNESAVQNLTMWRLYGDDTKGVCVKYRIDKTKLQKNGFYLAPVSYAIKDDIHYELEFIKYLFQIGEPNQWKLSLRNWNVWKHFFKKKIYSDEKEVRLLYIPNTVEYREKIHDDELTFNDEKSGVFSEMKIFKLDGSNPHFPLSIDHVWLGTNFAARQENVDQFNYFFSKSNIVTSKKNNEDLFSLCQIEDYR